MPGMQIDFTNVEVRDFTPIPPAWYECIVDSCEIRKSAAGNQFIAWQFRIVDGEYKNRVLFHNTSLVATALWNLKGLLENLGISVAKGVNNVDINQYSSRPIAVNVGQREYNGQMREDVLATRKSVNLGKQVGVPDVSDIVSAIAAPELVEGATLKPKNDDIPF